jgi:uncharacterized damage-inducible protein DinB
MSVDSKHMATFLLGAAAAFGAYKYSKLSDEEKDKLTATLKEKAHSLKDHAEGTVDKAKDYFEELKTKGADALKEHFPGVEDFFSHIFKSDTNTDAASGSAAATTVPTTNPV